MEIFFDTTCVYSGDIVSHHGNVCELLSTAVGFLCFRVSWKVLISAFQRESSTRTLVFNVRIHFFSALSPKRLILLSKMKESLFSVKGLSHVASSCLLKLKTEGIIDEVMFFILAFYLCRKK